MGRSAERISHALCCQVLQQLLAICVWHNRSLVLRKLLQRSGLWHDVATLSGGCGLGSLHGWRVGIQFWIWIRLGLRLSVGMDALPHRRMGFPARIRLGMATGRRLEQLVFATHCSECSQVIHSPACTRGRDKHRGREPRTGINLRRKQIGRPQQLRRSGSSSRPVWKHGEAIAKSSAAWSGQPARGCATGGDAFIGNGSRSCWRKSRKFLTRFAAYA